MQHIVVWDITLSVIVVYILTYIHKYTHAS